MIVVYYRISLFYLDFLTESHATFRPLNFDQLLTYFLSKNMRSFWFNCYRIAKDGLK